MSRTYKRKKNPYDKYVFCAYEHVYVGAIKLRGKLRFIGYDKYHDTNSERYIKREREYHSEKFDYSGDVKKNLKRYSNSLRRTNDKTQLSKIYRCEDFDDFDYDDSSVIKHCKQILYFWDL